MLIKRVNNGFITEDGKIVKVHIDAGPLSPPSQMYTQSVINDLCADVAVSLKRMKAGEQIEIALLINPDKPA